MIAYLKEKRVERKVKLMFYETVINIINNQKDILDLLHRMYIALKDVPVNELRDEIVTKMAEIIHEQNKRSK